MSAVIDIWWEATDTDVTASSSGTTSNPWWRIEDTTSVYYNYSFDSSGENVEIDPALKRQLQLEVSRAWDDGVRWKQERMPSPKFGLPNRPGWKHGTRRFLLSPQRIVSQRYGWQ